MNLQKMISHRQQLAHHRYQSYTTLHASSDKSVILSYKPHRRLGPWRAGNCLLLVVTGSREPGHKSLNGSPAVHQCDRRRGSCYPLLPQLAPGRATQPPGPPGRAATPSSAQAWSTRRGRSVTTISRHRAWRLRAPRRSLRPRPRRGATLNERYLPATLSPLRNIDRRQCIGLYGALAVLLHPRRLTINRSLAGNG